MNLWSRMLLMALMGGAVLGDAPASAQSVVCSKDMSSKSCDRLAIPTELELAELEAPADWIFVVFDAKDWRRASRMFGAEGRTDTAFTVFDLKTTFLNGEYIVRQLPRRITRTLAHEIGHIRCRCDSEVRASAVGKQLGRSHRDD